MPHSCLKTRPVPGISVSVRLDPGHLGVLTPRPVASWGRPIAVNSLSEEGRVVVAVSDVVDEGGSEDDEPVPDGASDDVPEGDPDILSRQC